MSVEEAFTLGIRCGFLIGLVGTLTIATYYAARRIPPKFRSPFSKALIAVALLYCGIFTYWTFIFEYTYYGYYSRNLLELLSYGLATGNLLYLGASVASLIILPLAARKAVASSVAADAEVKVPATPTLNATPDTPATLAKSVSEGLPHMELRGEEMVGIVTYIPKNELEGTLTEVLERALKQVQSRRPQRIEAAIQETDPQAQQTEKQEKKDEKPTFLIRREQR